MHQTPAFHRISRECATISGGCKLSWILPSKLRQLSVLGLNFIAMYLLVWSVEQHRITIQQHTEHTWLCISQAGCSDNLHAGNRGANKKGNAQKVLVNHFVPSGKSVEVDVVAQQARILFTESAKHLHLANQHASYARYQLYRVLPGLKSKLMSHLTFTAASGLATRDTTKACICYTPAIVTVTVYLHLSHMSASMHRSATAS